MGASSSTSSNRRNNNHHHHHHPNGPNYGPNYGPNNPTQPYPYAPQPYYSYNGPSYGPYYNNNNNYQNQGWAPQRPVPVTGPPPPYVDHQKAKKVRNDVNVHKDTIRLQRDDSCPDQFLVSFVYDALVDGSFTIFYFGKEEPNCNIVPLFPEAYTPIKFPFQKGVRQNFLQPLGTGVDLGFFELDDLAKPSPDEDVFPLVISAETSLPVPLPLEEQLAHSPVISSPHMQITQAVIQKKDENPFHVKVVKQILWIDEVRYELREIYGIGTSAESFKDDDPGKECVICMTEPKDTAVIPCRHMCLCSECAKELRIQSNKCPICRQPIEELIEIKINNVGE